MRVQYSLIGLLLGAGMAFASPALAAEQRCTELGANCVCSEPLNTNVLGGGPVFINPGDTTSQECTVEYGQATGYAVLNTQGSAQPITATNDSVILGRLPNRKPVVQWVWRQPELGIGEFSVGHEQYFVPCQTLANGGGGHPCTRTDFAALIPGTVGGSYISTARWAERFYVYISDNYQFPTQGGCTNGKRVLADNLDVIHGGGSIITSYNFDWQFQDVSAGGSGLCTALGLAQSCGFFKMDGPGGTNYEPDCCNSGGPVTSPSDISPNDFVSWNGRWWFFETIIENRLGPGFRMTVYGRDVTNNGPEKKFVDTNGAYGDPASSNPLAHGGGTYKPGTAQFTPNEITPIAGFLLGGKAYGYRAGVCTGFHAYTHYMQAQWDTNAGQRVGPAHEVEGGMGGPPPAPTNLRVISLRDQFLNMFSTLARLLG